MPVTATSFGEMLRLQSCESPQRMAEQLRSLAITYRLLTIQKGAYKNAPYVDPHMPLHDQLQHLPTISGVLFELHLLFGPELNQAEGSMIYKLVDSVFDRKDIAFMRICFRDGLNRRAAKLITSAFAFHKDEGHQLRGLAFAVCVSEEGLAVDLATDIASFLSYTTNLRTLSISLEYCKDSTISALCEVLKLIPTLRTFHLYSKNDPLSNGSARLLLFKTLVALDSIRKITLPLFTSSRPLERDFRRLFKSGTLLWTHVDFKNNWAFLSTDVKIQQILERNRILESTSEVVKQLRAQGVGHCINYIEECKSMCDVTIRMAKRENKMMREKLLKL